MTDKPTTLTVTKTEVYCSLLVEGTHCWPDCPFDEVFYLRSPHRHVFYVKAYKQVNHDDRDVEFIMLKHELTNYFYNEYFDPMRQLHVFNAKSCEMIARELVEKFKLTKCDVSEDNENGSVVMGMWL